MSKKKKKKKRKRKEKQRKFYVYGRVENVIIYWRKRLQLFGILKKKKKYKHDNEFCPETVFVSVFVDPAS